MTRPTKPGTNPQVREQLHAAYLMTYDLFSTDTAEVAEALGVEPRKALALLRKLEAVGLVTADEWHEGGSMDGSRARGRDAKYISLTWQCWKTYDDITRDEAEALFNEKVPARKHRPRNSKVTTRTTNPNTKEATVPTTTKPNTSKSRKAKVRAKARAKATPKPATKPRATKATRKPAKATGRKATTKASNSNGVSDYRRTQKLVSRTRRALKADPSNKALKARLKAAEQAHAATTKP